MSRKANDWAWELSIKPASLKLLLLSLCDRADEYFCCYPSIRRLVADTGLDQKTISSHMNKLIMHGIIVDTGERKGMTKRVKVYRLIGMKNGVTKIDIRSTPNTPENGSIPEKRNTPKNGGIRNQGNRSENGSTNTPNNGSTNRSENGSLNQSKEPAIEPIKYIYTKNDFDDEYLEQCFLVFWLAGLKQINPTKTVVEFEQRWLESGKEPFEFAEELRQDIQRRVANNQFGFGNMYPATYLRDKRWLDPYVITDGGNSKSISRAQQQVNDIQLKITNIKSVRNSSLEAYNMHKSNGAPELTLQSYASSMRKSDQEIEELAAHLQRLTEFESGGIQ